jgi:two-component system response regulator DctR
VNNPIQILAIDDERDVLYTLQAIGARLGWQVHTVSDSTEAVSMFLSIRPDLVLVDYHMPKQDGLSTVKALRRQSPTVPIIVLTVDDRQEVANLFLDAGASDFANKPVKIPDLAARIKVHLQLVQQHRCYMIRRLAIRELLMLLCSSFVTLASLCENHF